MNYRTITACRSCNNPALAAALDCGEQYIASTFVKTDERSQFDAHPLPLSVALCDRSKNASACGLLQLWQTVDRDFLYQHYFYRSGTTITMRDALKNVVEDLQNKIMLRGGDAVLDIGCNDGTLLGYLPPTVRRVGIDPATNLDWSHLHPSIAMLHGYFSEKIALDANGGAPYRAITCIATLYDLDDPNACIAGIKNALAPDGILCLQVASLAAVVESMNFCDICHQHLCYYSLATLGSLLARHGLLIFDASVNSVNGGSIRVFASRSERPRPASVQYMQLLERERSLCLDDPRTYADLYAKIQSLSAAIRAFVEREYQNGGLVIGLSASVKGNVLLQWFGFDRQLIPALSERNPEKIGLYTFGTDIPIISEEEARLMKPTAMLALVSFFKDEIISRERLYLEQGGKLIFPIPIPLLVTKEGEQPLL